MSQFVFPTIECAENSSTYGRFVTAEPHLPKGFGVVVGNSLRRMLLSSLTGTAVTSVKIEGVQHEFQTIPYAKEDVIELLLNIKGLRLSATGDNWPKKMILDVKGAGEIHADRIKPTDGLEVINPELYLASLDSEEGHLVMEFNVEQGIGYKVASRADSMGLFLLRQRTQIEPMVLSTETNPVVAARCKKLNLPVFQGIDDKASVLKEILAQKRIKPENVLYIGNDVNDLPCFPIVGCAVVPADAEPQVLRAGDLVLHHNGGHGAVRELCDLLIQQYSVE